MTELERAIVDLVRMGLRADVSSVQQYARRLLRRAGKGSGPEGDFREALGEVLLQSPAPHPSLRRGRLAEETTPVPESPVRDANLANQLAPVESFNQRDSSAAGNLVRVENPSGLPLPVLDVASSNKLSALLKERANLETLASARVSPTRTVLLTGAPGVGKTLTATYIASALSLPLVTVDLASVMSSFLGRTGQNLREVLAFARNHRCVLLLDEFDALAKRRDDQTDVGELKRIVNVLLTELERWPDTTLLLAATNHPELLDRAIWRRFELVITMEPPNAKARRDILEREIAIATANGNPVAVSDTLLDACAVATDGFSGSDVCQFLKTSIRAAAISEASLSELLFDAVSSRVHAGDRKDDTGRRKLAQVAINELGWNQRQTGEFLGVSHVTVGNWMKKAPKKIAAGHRISASLS